MELSNSLNDQCIHIIKNTLDNVYDGEKWQEFYNGHLNEQMPNVCEDLCGRNYPNEISLLGDAKTTLQQILKENLTKLKIDDWREKSTNIVSSVCSRFIRKVIWNQVIDIFIEYRVSRFFKIRYM